MIPPNSMMTMEMKFGAEYRKTMICVVEEGFLSDTSIRNCPAAHTFDLAARGRKTGGSTFYGAAAFASDNDGVREAASVVPFHF